MKPCFFCLESNCTICPLHIYSYSFCIWKGTQTHLRHCPFFTEKHSLGQRLGVRTSTLYTLFSPWNNKQGWSYPAQELFIIQTIGSIQSSHVQENQDKAVPPSVTLHCLCSAFCPTAPFYHVHCSPAGSAASCSLPRAVCRSMTEYNERQQWKTKSPAERVHIGKLPTAQDLLQGTWSGLFPEGLVPAEGCHEHPIYVPVSPRMSLKPTIQLSTR